MALLSAAEYELRKNFTNTDMRNVRKKTEGNRGQTLLNTGTLNGRTRQGYERYLKRWYPLIPHPVQMRLVQEDKRFKVVPAGRRSGKTERAKRYIIKQAMANPEGIYFIAAPTRAQVKRIYWEDIKTMSFWRTHAKKPSETELKIHLNNESTIELIGLDKPERIEGSFWTGGIVDEIANVKEDAWEKNIRPALDTFDPSKGDEKPWCWLIGVPDGLNHYYDLAQYSQNSGDPDWGFYTWKSADILPEEIIKAAKRSMSSTAFAQEYEASFETATGKIYSDYGKQNHTSAMIEPHELLHWSHDQNFTPLSSCVSVVRGENIFLLDEIVLTSAVSKQAALEFVEKFKCHENKIVHIYGDPAGRAGEKHGHSSDYTEIEAVLRSHGWKFVRKVKRKAPAIKDRQNALRARICNALGDRFLFVNPSKAPWVDKGLATVQLKKGSSFQEDQSNQYQHITTAVGYMIDVLYPAVDFNEISQVIRL